MMWPFALHREAPDGWRAFETGLRDFIPKCMACGKDISGHAWTQFASCIAYEKNKNKLNWFSQVFLQERWKDLRTERSFDGTKNALVIYALLCSGGGQIIAVKSAFELYEGDSLLAVQQVREIAASEIRDLTTDWHIIEEQQFT